MPYRASQIGSYQCLARTIAILGLMALIAGIVCGNSNADDNGYEGKKVLHVEAYHEGYEWSDGISQGIRTVFKDTGVELKTIHLNTKINTSEEFIKNAVLQARGVIEEWKPDVVIASDDNVAKYLIVPYYKNSDQPIVFCGVNWDASAYGLPFENTTGMIEVDRPLKLVEQIGKFSEGNRVGLISADVFTERRIAEYYKAMLGDELKTIFARNMTDFKKKFLSLQNEVDMILFLNNSGIAGWNAEEAETFILENIRIPVGTSNVWMSRFALVTVAKLPEEQGAWAAQAALQILDGTSPKDIPIARNSQAKLILNLNIAQKLDVIFDLSLLKTATIISLDNTETGSEKYGKIQ